jgi:hypothetical protein
VAESEEPLAKHSRNDDEALLTEPLDIRAADLGHDATEAAGRPAPQLSFGRRAEAADC